MVVLAEKQPSVIFSAVPFNKVLRLYVWKGKGVSQPFDSLEGEGSCGDLTQGQKCVAAREGSKEPKRDMRPLLNLREGKGVLRGEA